MTQNDLNGVNNSDDCSDESQALRTTRLPNTSGIVIMKSIFGVIVRGLVFGLFVASASFILVYLPAAFKDHVPYVNIIIVSTLVFFILYVLAFLISWSMNLITHVSQADSPAPRTSPTRHTDQDVYFREFFARENEAQHLLLVRVAGIQSEVERLLNRSSNQPMPSRATQQQQPETDRFSEIQRPPRCMQGSTLQCISNEPCRNCGREFDTCGCGECLRNIDCNCKETEAEKQRIRNFRREQEVQVSRMVERTKIQGKLDAMRRNQ